MNDQLVCLWGAPSPIYKGVEEGEGPTLLGAPQGESYSRSRTPTLPRVGVGEREGGERGKERGAPPPSLSNDETSCVNFLTKNSLVLLIQLVITKNKLVQLVLLIYILNI